MMAGNERGISSVMSTGSLQADASGQWPGIARSTRMLQLGSSPESLRLYIPFLYFINTICLVVFFSLLQIRTMLLFAYNCATYSFVQVSAKVAPQPSVVLLTKDTCC